MNKQLKDRYKVTIPLRFKDDKEHEIYKDGYITTEFYFTVRKDSKPPLDLILRDILAAFVTLRNLMIDNERKATITKVDE